jgi:hypothetical protein
MLVLAVVLATVCISTAALITLERITTHNTATVVPGELYRAAQLNDTDLRTEIARFRIKSVINLRGGNLQSAWYRDELTVCRNLQVVHADVSMSAKNLPAPDQVAKLVQDFSILPRPMLIHCNAGSDRTGLAGSIYLIESKACLPSDATRELSWHFGHFAIYPYFEMNEFIQLFQVENPQRRTLADWVRLDYPGIYTDEARETTWHEICEPFESLVGIPYWIACRSVPIPIKSSLAGSGITGTR